jgi:hypothetical protein
LSHTTPVPQLVPLAWFDHALVDELGVQTWQALPPAVLSVPEAYKEKPK